MQLVNNNKRVDEFAALISKYQAIGILDKVLNTKIRMMGAKKFISLDKRIRRASTRIRPGVENYQDKLKEVQNRRFIYSARKPIGMQLADPQPSSEAQASPAYI